MSAAGTSSGAAAAGAPAPRLDLVFVNQHYAPDVASTGQHLTDLAEFLAQRGHRVRVFTAQGRYVAGRLEAPHRELRNGVEVTRLESTGFGRGTHLRRIADYASFYLRLLLALATMRKAHGIIFLTTPPLLSVLGRLLRAARGQRYAIWSMDLHPEAEIASGMLRRDSLVARVLAQLDRLAYRGADFVVDLGPYMKRRIIAKGVDPERTATVAVWSREEEIVPMPLGRNPLRRELGLDGTFVVMYSGNAGIAHDFTAILEAMRRLRAHPRIRFLFVGGGPRRSAIETFIAEHALTNASYREYFDREQLRHSLTMADAHLVSLREPFVGIAVPGKLYGIMAAARPVLFLGPSRCESAETIETHGAGLVIDPADGGAADRLVDVLQRWSADPTEAEAMGRRGREAFLRGFERLPSCSAFEEVVVRQWGRAGDTRVWPAERGPPQAFASSTSR